MSDVLDLQIRNVKGSLIVARVSRLLSDPHLHDTYTVCLMRKGIIHFEVHGVKYSAAPGDMFLIHPYEVHWGGNAFDPIEYDVFYIDKELMKDWTRQRSSDGSFPQLPTAVAKESPLTRPLFEAVDRCLNGPLNVESENAFADGIAKIFLEMSDGMRTTGIPEGDCKSIERACKILHDQSSETVDLSKLPSQVGLSRYYFIRLFRSMTGLTPRAYLRQVRLSQAAKSIAEGDTLAGAAFGAGFADQPHMSRTFREVFGFAPGQLTARN
mgnify:CR=1 FL=1|tara:strand:+ start:1547 stop:2350 length:804 start_codon:yes stop_codon:yes gene_type:complete